MPVNWSRLQGVRTLTLAAAAFGMVAAMASPATADDTPTAKQILADCASGVGKCTFNSPQLGKAYLGDFHRVSDTLYNCSASPATESMTWTDSVSSSDSLGVSIAEGAGLEGIVNLSVTETYDHTWTSEHSEESSATATVEPGEIGWIARAQVMQTVSGVWQTHYDDRHWGRYTWFLHDTIIGPAPNDTDGKQNVLVVMSRKMTERERQSCSGARKGNAFDPARPLMASSAIGRLPVSPHRGSQGPAGQERLLSAGTDDGRSAQVHPGDG
ncbi:hypothetical protein AB0N17_44005 [Streptomyces sp. NPDC051133]|uniref:hypothetical protein n=1 Tax=Streptomyces sp. NPDC051133 TaxID=3155521 RepID=UPI003449BC21